MPNGLDGDGARRPAAPAEPLASLDLAVAADSGWYARGAIGLLSPRQRQVLALLADGHSNAMIATSLDITTKTAEKHVRNIYDVLQLPAQLRLNRRVGATVTWMNADMDDPPPSRNRFQAQIGSMPAGSA